MTSLQPHGRGKGDNRCYTQIWLDDVLIFGNRAGDELVNLNHFATGNIEAIEYYPGPASTPLKYSLLESNCGVLVLHSRRARK